MKKASIIIVIIIIIMTLTTLSACGDMFAGKSAYELAVDNGFEGTLSEWLDSLKGQDGSSTMTGKSAYELAVDNGFEGTVAEWLESLKGGGNNSDYLSYAANKGILSSVLVFCEFSKGMITSNSAGSGIIMDEDKEKGDAYIATNYHVVYDASSNSISNSIKIFLFGQELEKYTIDAEYIGGSLTYDIAVLKISSSQTYKNSVAQAVELSDSLTHYAGDTAIAIGNPQGNGFSVTAGIIGVDSEYIDMDGADGITPVRFRVMRVDTAVNSGNSGGGLFNSTGQLIGMVNAKIMSNNVENIGYAIPIGVVKSAYNNILRNCDGESNVKIMRCLLGIEIAANDSHAYYNPITAKVEVKEDIEVKTVSETGAAFGKLEVGDIIKSFSYKGTTIEVSRNFIIVDYSLNFEKDTNLTLHIMRKGIHTTVEVMLVNITEVI